MQLVNKTNEIIRLKLNKDLRKNILQGHPWVFQNSLCDLPKATPGSPATLLDKKDKFLAHGYYDPESSLSFRVCSLEKKQKPNSFWAGTSLTKALQIRNKLNFNNTNCYRLFNGEGDRLPGLICDLYNKTAVVQLDGPSAIGFWKLEDIALWLSENLNLECVVYKPRSDLNLEPQILWGKLNTGGLIATENKIDFFIDPIEGQKTGFFLDQRDNRNYIKSISKDLMVLNLFAYTGGFSVYAGLGGAKGVTSVDISGPACEYAEKNWELNNLASHNHQAIKRNVFDFIDDAIFKKQTWDIVIVDPPSFANKKSTLEKALQSYETVFTKSIQLVNPKGFIALSSCSSLITPKKFLEINTLAFSKAQTRAKLKFSKGQPLDHPFPEVCANLEYLKFNVFKTV